MNIKYCIILIFTLSLSCRVRQYFNQGFVKTTTNDSTIYYSENYKYYNPFSRSFDTLYTINNELSWVSWPVITRLSVKNEEGKLDFIFNNGVKFLECNIVNNKITGLCVRYYLPGGKDTLQIANFYSNRLNGELKYYGVDGALIFHKLYKKGKVRHEFQVPELD